MVTKEEIKKEHFSKKDLELAKKLAYNNSEEAEIGFVFNEVWITNPFLEETGRFEFEDFEAMCEYYGKENVCKFIFELLKAGGK